MSVVCLLEHETTSPSGLSLQALTLARRLAELRGTGLAALVFGEPSPEVVATLGEYGVAQVHCVEGFAARPDPAGPEYAPRAWAQAARELAAELAAVAVVAAGSDRGHEVLAHLAALADLPMAAGCVQVDPDGPALRLTRLRWAGSLLEEAVLDAPLALLAVAPQQVAPVPATAPVTPQLHRRRPAVQEADLRERVVSSLPRPPGAVSLAEAKVVVGGGRGVGGPEGFAVLEELAALLGGAVGVSRVATSLGWRPHRDQVGQTGTRIAPELYLACGISGAIQHMAGCKGAKRLLAVNTDPDAPIMRAADYAVVGDLHEVLPAVVEALRAGPG